MKRLLSCRFEIDTGCVELIYSDRTMLSIDCTAAEDVLEISTRAKADLDWLIYNEPLTYADLILNGGMEEYLRLAGQHPDHGLED